MTRDPVTIHMGAPLDHALEILIERDLSALPVVDESGSVVGILNERHVLRAVGDLDAMTIRAIMDTAPVTVEVYEPIVEFIDALMEINVRQVIVLEDSTIVGIITRADLMPAVLEILQKRSRQPRWVSVQTH